MVKSEKNKISVNKFRSYNYKSLCKGCKHCVKGEKTVIYITGICPRKCFYCPLSEQKKDKDVIFANETKVSTIKEIVNECKLSGSKGAGITGGDPLTRLNRTIKTIKQLKKTFGKSFHIHLYTSLNLINMDVLSKLELAGLDEIRVHPDLDNKKLWDNIFMLEHFNWNYGIEIPAIPKKQKQIKDLIKFANNNIQFLNINEFEYSDTNQKALHKLGYFCESEDTYAIKGSNALAKSILKWSKDNFPKLSVHYCTAELKDATQLANRFKLRSKNIAKPFDVVDEEGMIVRGVIRTRDKRNVKKLIKNFEIPRQLIEFDKERKQILIAGWVLQDIYENLPLQCEIVTEYPTSDRLIVDVLPLTK